MSVWYGWPTDRSDETFEINASEVNCNLNLNTNSNSGTIFNGITTTNWISSIDTFRDTAIFTINPFDEKHEQKKEEDMTDLELLKGMEGKPDDYQMSMHESAAYFRSLCKKDEEAKDFQAELVEKLNDCEFQAAARQRYKILAGITNVKPTGKYLEMNQFGYIAGINEEGHVPNEHARAKIINTDKIPTDNPEWIEDSRAELAAPPSWWNASFNNDAKEDFQSFKENLENMPIDDAIKSAVNNDIISTEAGEAFSKFDRDIDNLVDEILEKDDSMPQGDSIASELRVKRASVRSAKSLKELTQELQYDLEREPDVAERANLIIGSAMCIKNKLKIG